MAIATIQPAFVETAESYGVDASSKLGKKKRSMLGQFMTPAPTARFMASMFSEPPDDFRVLDPGAGTGSLTAALVERLCQSATKARSAYLECYEIEPLLIEYLEGTLQEAESRLQASEIQAEYRIYEEDFIVNHSIGIQHDFFRIDCDNGSKFTHVIMNPPYKKIHSASVHRHALRKAGIETSNFYTGFMFLAAQRLVDAGELVAIIPRSFCNGPYFKQFRKQFLSMMSLRRIHVFASRDDAFRNDNVLQENIIIHAIKGANPAKVRITASEGANFELDAASGECITEDMTQLEIDYASVIRPDDPDKIIHIATNRTEQTISDRIMQFNTPLAELGLEVSTGPVVDFRLQSLLRESLEQGTVPLLYPAHFQGSEMEWPKKMKKPNAIRVTDESRKWLWQNQGNFVITRRFTSKEERRRVVASVYGGELPGELVGFENHLNVYHAKRKGFSSSLASGLSAYLNSAFVDGYFRQFSGHTQVNATDLRLLRYPERGVLERIGMRTSGAKLSQQDIDRIISAECADMTSDENPIEGQQKIDNALHILKALGLPRGQQNERSALTLLALVALKPSDDWNLVSRPLMGITPIMQYCREHYGREYAPNTRETFRRQTMHQFVEAGIALHNPDDPSRAVNSPRTSYQISEEAFKVIRTFGTDRWETTLKLYLEGQPTLAAKWAKYREMRMVPVRLPEGEEINLTPGSHSELIREIIAEFAPRFAPGSELICVGDTGDKIGYFKRQRLIELGVTELDRHGKMPDVVLYFESKKWLLLVESVTSHGPIDPKRHNELANLFSTARVSIVYVTAFPDRSIMARHLSDISWETEVWCANAPTHLIHFDGERFLGPYEG